MSSILGRASIAIVLLAPILTACAGSKSKKRAPKQDDIPGQYQNPDDPGKGPLPINPLLVGDWFNLSGTEGGINVDQVYAEARFEHEVIVAVIDTGIASNHPDLKDQLWTNPKEIPGNKIDDDGNGYVDDIHGWNYLVAADGSNIEEETLEVTRELRRLTELQKTRPLDDKERAYLAEVKEAYDEGKAGEMENSKHYDLSSQQRGDDLDDFTPINAEHSAYGNNEIGDLHSHGTHVSGIIAANRNNDKGIRGIADKARIMSLRVVPDGDEQDKDIYHAIHYAVDMGARVINMSFGKTFSRHPDKVQEAFQYAADHNVLLVHSAGNSASDMDSSISYPSRAANVGLPLSDSWLDVGAVSRGSNSPIAFFSSYGKQNVDIFAPGVDILSSVPANAYQMYSGTSMASPVVAGTAALMISAFPDVKAKDLRNFILESARKQDNQGARLALADKSIAGGVIDAYALFQKLKQEASAH